MKFVKTSRRPQPKASLILLDWSVRESFHLLHYLSRQDVDRDSFEVIIIEYYSRISDAIRPFEDQVDTWLLLEMPETCYYQKHLMCNAGIVLSLGEVCVICDSDAMVKESFIRTIIDEFDRNSNLVLHLDEFRNIREDFYPFNYPSFEEVIGKGCINNFNGRTKGVVDTEDPVHNLNYGACMCARREDMIAIGGADEHLDFVGHICGPYDMTFRLGNKGIREIWSQSEFLYHTWHPGQAGVGNYLGPHDGRHVSATALEALTTRRVLPLVENRAIELLRTRTNIGMQILYDLIIRKEDIELWDREKLVDRTRLERVTLLLVSLGNYKGFRLFFKPELGVYYGHLIIEEYSNSEAGRCRTYQQANSERELREKVNRYLPKPLQYIIKAGTLFMFLWQGVGYGVRAANRTMSKISSFFR